MKNPNQIKRNYIFNTLYQVLSILSPIVTAPYVSRVLGASAIGAFSYTNSIVSYIVLFATLGLTAYASRQIAFFQGKRKEQTRIFSEVVTLKIILLIPAFFVLILISKFNSDYSRLLLIQGLYLLDVVVNIDWLFIGNEDFLITASRSLIIKIACIILIFILVKSPDDIIIYVLIMAGANLMGGATLWLVKNKYVDKMHLCIGRFKIHLYGGLSLFFIQMAWSIYTYLDKVMIGQLAGDIAENGYYEQAQKIIMLSTTLITSMSTVLLPRISNAFMENDIKEIETCMEKSIRFSLVLGMPMSFGLTACAPNIVPWFFGEGYDKCIYLLQVLSPVILISSLYNMFGYQYLLGTKKEKIMTIIILAGSVVNFTLNLMLIPKHGSVGASVASVLAQTIIVAFQIHYVSRQIRIKSMKSTIVKTMISSGSMYIFLVMLNKRLESGLLQTVFLIVTGALLYFIALVIFKEEFLKEFVKLKRGGNQ